MLTCAICTHQQNQTVSISGTKLKREVEGSSCSDLYVTRSNTSVLCDDSEKVPPTCGKSVVLACTYGGVAVTAGHAP